VKTLDNMNIYKKLLGNLTVKELWESVYICPSYQRQSSVLLLETLLNRSRHVLQSITCQSLLSRSDSDWIVTEWHGSMVFRFSSLDQQVLGPQRPVQWLRLLDQTAALKTISRRRKDSCSGGYGQIPQFSHNMRNGSAIFQYITNLQSIVSGRHEESRIFWRFHAQKDIWWPCSTTAKELIIFFRVGFLRS